MSEIHNEIAIIRLEDENLQLREKVDQLTQQIQGLKDYIHDLELNQNNVELDGPNSMV